MPMVDTIIFLNDRPILKAAGRIASWQRGVCALLVSLCFGILCFRPMTSHTDTRHLAMQGSFAPSANLLADRAAQVSPLHRSVFEGTTFAKAPPALCSRIAHISTGAQRVALCPPSEPCGPGAKIAMADEGLRIQREKVVLANGDEIFYQVITATRTKPTHILVFFHGYGGHSDNEVESMRHVAKAGAKVVLPDLLGHGRSSGLLGYIKDWFKLVDQMWRFIDLVVTPSMQSPTGKKIPGVQIKNRNDNMI